MNANARLTLGVALMALGLVAPFGTMVVVATGWPTVVKTCLNVLLQFGPQILAIPAVALLGKENYDRIVRSVLKVFKPTGHVSRLRYNIGLLMFLGPIMYGWNAVYVPALLPENEAARMWASMGLDITLLTSLFVLGGDFWDKVQALFLYDARCLSRLRSGGIGTSLIRDAGARTVRSVRPHPRDARAVRSGIQDRPSR
jgi:hypothetical protein